MERWKEEGAEQTFTELMLDHERFGLELPAAADVRACLAALEWEREVRDALSMPAAAADAKDKKKSLSKSADSSPASKKPGGSEPLPQLEILEDLRERAKDINTDDMEEELREELARRLEKIDEWSEKVDSAMGLNDRVATKQKPASVLQAAANAEKRPTPEVIQELVEQGKKLPAIVPRVTELETILDEHRRWVEAARKLLGPPKPKPSAEQLAEEAAAAATQAADQAAADEESATAAAKAAAEAVAEAERLRKSKKRGEEKGGSTLLVKSRPPPPARSRTRKPRPRPGRWRGWPPPPLGSPPPSTSDSPRRRTRSTTGPPWPTLSRCSRRARAFRSNPRRASSSPRRRRR